MSVCGVRIWRAQRGRAECRRIPRCSKDAAAVVRLRSGAAGGRAPSAPERPKVTHAAWQGRLSAVMHAAWRRHAWRPRSCPPHRARTQALLPGARRRRGHHAGMLAGELRHQRWPRTRGGDARRRETLSRRGKIASATSARARDGRLSDDNRHETWEYLGSLLYKALHGVAELSASNPEQWRQHQTDAGETLVRQPHPVMKEPKHDGLREGGYGTYHPPSGHESERTHLHNQGSDACPLPAAPKGRKGDPCPTRTPAQTMPRVWNLPVQICNPSVRCTPRPRNEWILPPEASGPKEPDADGDHDIAWEGEEVEGFS